MTFRPSSKSKKEKILSISLAVAAVILFLVSGLVNRLVVVYQLTAFVCGILSIEMYLKYVGSSYIYEAAEDSFKVYKVTGKKSICVSSLDYEMSLSHVVSKEEYEERKDSFPKTNFNVNLCKNFAPDSYYLYFFEFNGKKSMMKFEPDQMFADYLNDKISAAWEKAENEDDEDY
ncbi:MAG: hypothetical protein E7600_04405 [Ruminococcaceae bacterium]|nr:hypothetical protein [Oscillospiraceae bacterium]